MWQPQEFQAVPWLPGSRRQGKRTPPYAAARDYRRRAWCSRIGARSAQGSIPNWTPRSLSREQNCLGTQPAVPRVVEKESYFITALLPPPPTLTPAYLARTWSLEPSLRVIHVVERVAAGLALLLLAPFGAVVAIIIYFLSRSTPLVRHTRVGWRGAPLPMLKFRTMWSSGEASGRLLAIENVSGEIPSTKGAADTRVGSRFAAFCRRHSIDELPQ
ncbi:MAG TPA: hypothetical protein DEQ47_09435, partial [Solibacterales bacterium]|nr:hypothetical protein [Bryobacterales bacterium]